MVDNRTSEVVQAEISQIEQSVIEMGQEYEAVLNELAASYGSDNKKLEQQPALLQSRQEAARRRLDMLKAELREIEQGDSWAAYEQFYKEAHDHFTKVQEIDAELKALDERRELLIKGRGDIERTYRQGSHAKMTKLRRILVENNGPEFGKREKSLYQKYRVEGYL